MDSWVRYCITVYIGLLLSGALARPPWTHRYPPEPAAEQGYPAATKTDATQTPPHDLPGKRVDRALGSDTLSG